MEILLRRSPSKISEPKTYGNTNHSGTALPSVIVDRFVHPVLLQTNFAKKAFPALNVRTSSAGIQFHVSPFDSIAPALRRGHVFQLKFRAWMGKAGGPFQWIVT